MKNVVNAISVIALFLSFTACSSCPKEAVDLGLVLVREDGTPYNLFWAKSNLSENGLCAHPEDYGDYYAWGEKSPKNCYDWPSYRGTGLGREDNAPRMIYDTAHTILGGKWRIPTKDEWEALQTQCIWIWITRSGVNGYLVTGKNGNSIFLPAAGARYETTLNDVGSEGAYWSSSPDKEPHAAFGLGFDEEDVDTNPGARCLGVTVRPVSE